MRFLSHNSHCDSFWFIITGVDPGEKPSPELLCGEKAPGEKPSNIFCRENPSASFAAFGEKPSPVGEGGGLFGGMWRKVLAQGPDSRKASSLSQISAEIMLKSEIFVSAEILLKLGFMKGILAKTKISAKSGSIKTDVTDC